MRGLVPAYKPPPWCGNPKIEGTLQWLAKQQEEMQKALQAFQQSNQVERQTLLTWQAGQQKTLQDFIREPANVQQQLLQKMESPLGGDGPRAPGVGLCKMGPDDDPSAFLCMFEWVAMGADGIGKHGPYDWPPLWPVIRTLGR